VPSDVKTTMSTHWLQLVLDKPFIFLLEVEDRAECYVGVEQL